MALIVYAALRTRTMTTTPGLVGARLSAGMAAVVRRPLEPVGSVYAGGEEWTARTVGDQPLDRGTTVRIVGMEGLTVIVEPDPQSSPA
jgi:membrane protein implicated in regulation of membrane protease activity